MKLVQSNTMLRNLSLPALLLISTTLLGGPVADTPELRTVVSGLQRPVALRHAGDGSGRLFIVERDGVIRILAGGELLAAPFLDVSGLTATGGDFDERGLLGLAFHPAYSSNGRFFIYYTDNNSDTVVAEYAVSAADENIAEANGVILLRADQDFNNHNGGDIHFGPDGYLYIGLGDGGSGNDPCERAQTLDPANLVNTTSPQNCAADTVFLNSGGNADSRALLGKMLRIDVDATTPAGANQLCASNADGSASYAIPPDNPFAGADANSACDEVWAYGLRNPYRFSFDRDTGDLWIGDVGQSSREEVDLQPVSSMGGEDYGWDDCEGTLDRESTGCPSGSGRTAPILDYAHSGGRCSITGGFRYRGALSRYSGRYIFGDYCTGEIFEAVDNMGSWSFSVLFDPGTDPTAFCDTGVCLSGFGEDAGGELYAIDFTGVIYQITIDDLVFEDSFE